MIIRLPKSQQTLIYLTGGLTMLSASLSILNELSIYLFLFSMTVAILSIVQIESIFAKSNREPSAWGLRLLRLSRELTPEAYTTVEITPSGYNFKPRIKEYLTIIIEQAIRRIVKHTRPQKTEVKIDVLEETSLLFIQIKGMANSELEANQLIQKTDDQIEEYVRILNGSTMFESHNGETAILIEFPNEQS